MKSLTVVRITGTIVWYKVSAACLFKGIPVSMCASFVVYFRCETEFSLLWSFVDVGCANSQLTIIAMFV